MQPPAQQEVRTHAELIDWYRLAPPGASCIYHVGSLAEYRAKAASRLLTLQYQQDSRSPTNPLPPAQSFEMQRLLDTNDLLETITDLSTSGLLHLTQRRIGEGQFAYLAVKKRAK